MKVAEHHTADELRHFIRREKRGLRARRLQAVLGVLEGRRPEDLADHVQATGRSIRTWVTRYNAHGLAGLDDRPGRGRKPPLTPEQLAAFRARIVAGPTAADGVCSLRGEDARRILAEEFGVVRQLQAVYNLLHALDLEVLTPRPQHPDADPDAQDAFKKKRPRSVPRSPQTTPPRNSKSGSRTRPASARKGR
jgi:transposase